MTYTELRAAYPDFIYHGWEIRRSAGEVTVCYRFETKGLARFAPTWHFESALFPQEAEDDPCVQRLIFSLGMVELVSYWKLTCSPHVQVDAGALNADQIRWWKKLYFNGLGEFFFLNGIDAERDSFMQIAARPGPDVAAALPQPQKPLRGSLVPIGGGKDSIVTLDLLKATREENRCFIINPRPATTGTAQMAGYRPDQILAVRRTLDGEMLRLNREGFLNGHTPFSALVAFGGVLTAYLAGNRYLVLSNEDSANEPTVHDLKVNHQYSKSFEFEEDFGRYLDNYIRCGVGYFSLLRPWSEYQIARYFSTLKAFHPLFRSCNRGSKTDSWCADCSKCLFVACILSPFLSRRELTDIFGTDLLDKASLAPVLEQLVGLVPDKPFECVGSRQEVCTALCQAISLYTRRGEELPALLAAFRRSPLYTPYTRENNPYLHYYNPRHLLPPAYLQLLLQADRAADGQI